MEREYFLQYIELVNRFTCAFLNSSVIKSGLFSDEKSKW